MKTSYAILLTFPFYLLLAHNAQAANAAHGKELHDANCLSCHASLMGGDPNMIYTRPDRRINNLDDLGLQVNRCKSIVGVSWPQDHIDDVVEYLNSNFYKFK